VPPQMKPGSTRRLSNRLPLCSKKPVLAALWGAVGALTPVSMESSVKGRWQLCGKPSEAECMGAGQAGPGLKALAVTASG
jgi:hypothetical protein